MASTVLVSKECPMCETNLTDLKTDVQEDHLRACLGELYESPNKNPAIVPRVTRTVNSGSKLRAPSPDSSETATSSSEGMDSDRFRKRLLEAGSNVFPERDERADARPHYECISDASSSYSSSDCEWLPPASVAKRLKEEEEKGDENVDDDEDSEETKAVNVKKEGTKKEVEAENADGSDVNSVLMSAARSVSLKNEKDHASKSREKKPKKSKNNSFNVLRFDLLPETPDEFRKFVSDIRKELPRIERSIHHLELKKRYLLTKLNEARDIMGDNDDDTLENDHWRIDEEFDGRYLNQDEFEFIKRRFEYWIRRDETQKSLEVEEVKQKLWDIAGHSLSQEEQREEILKAYEKYTKDNGQYEEPTILQINKQAQAEAAERAAKELEEIDLGYRQSQFLQKMVGMADKDMSKSMASAKADQSTMLTASAMDTSISTPTIGLNDKEQNNEGNGGDQEINFETRREAFQLSGSKKSKTATQAENLNLNAEENEGEKMVISDGGEMDFPHDYGDDYLNWDDAAAEDAEFQATDIPTIEQLQDQEVKNLQKKCQLQGERGKTPSVTLTVSKNSFKNIRLPKKKANHFDTDSDDEVSSSLSDDDGKLKTVIYGLEIEVDEETGEKKPLINEDTGKPIHQEFINDREIDEVDRWADHRVREMLKKYGIRPQSASGNRAILKDIIMYNKYSAIPDLYRDWHDETLDKYRKKQLDKEEAEARKREREIERRRKLEEKMEKKRQAELTRQQKMQEKQRKEEEKTEEQKEVEELRKKRRETDKRQKMDKIGEFIDEDEETQDYLEKHGSIDLSALMDRMKALKMKVAKTHVKALLKERGIECIEQKK